LKHSKETKHRNTMLEKKHLNFYDKLNILYTALFSNSMHFVQLNHRTNIKSKIYLMPDAVLEQKKLSIFLTVRIFLITIFLLIATFLLQILIYD